MVGRSQRSRFVRASDAAWRTLVLLALLTVVVLACAALANIVIPTLLAVLVVPVARPLFTRLDRRLPSSAAAAVVVALALAVLVAATWLMVWSVASNWDDLSAGVGDATTRVTDWLEVNVPSLEDADLTAIADALEGNAGAVATFMLGGLARSVTLVGASVVGVVMFLAVFFFGVRDWESFHAWIVRNSPVEERSDVASFLTSADGILRSYWRSQALIGIFDAVAIWLVLVLVGAPLALPIAILTFVISFIPYLGAIISTALAVLVTLGTVGPLQAVIVLAASLFIFNTGENLMRPLAVGSTMEMSTFVAFLSGVVGAAIGGAFGAIAAIPVVALAIEAKRRFFPGEQVGETRETAAAPELGDGPMPDMG